MLDTRQPALTPQAKLGLTAALLMPLFLPNHAQAANDLQVGVRPVLISVEGHARQYAGTDGLVCNAGATLGDGYEIYTAVVAYHNPAIGNVVVGAVNGTAALTSGGTAAPPTDAEVEAAIPSAVRDTGYFRLGVAKFARSGSAITVSLYHNKAERGSPADLNDVADSYQQQALTVGLYRYKETLSFPMPAASIANGDLVTARPLGYYGKIAGWRVICVTPITTGSKTATLNMEINTTDVTTAAAVYAGTKAMGELDALPAPSAANIFAPGDTFSLEAASVTAFVEGQVIIEVELHELVQA